MFEWWSGQPGSRAISQQFRLQRDIRCSSATVHEFLCDLHNYEELHPLIETISDLETAADLPHVRRYRVVDRVQFGPLRLRIVYTAALQALTPTTVRGYAWQFPGVRLETLYEISESSPGLSCVCESVRVSAPWGLGRMVTRQARDAHRKTLERLKRHLET